MLSAENGNIFATLSATCELASSNSAISKDFLTLIFSDKCVLVFTLSEASLCHGFHDSLSAEGRRRRVFEHD